MEGSPPQKTIMLWDTWANPVADSISVYFTLNPPDAASIIAEAKTGNIKPNSGEDEAWPGVAWTTIQYNASQLFEFPEIVATTTGHVCLDDNGDIAMINSNIESSSSNSNGGAIYGDEYESFYFENTSLINSTAQSSGGGIWIGDHSKIEAVNSHFDNNSSGSQGGGIYFESNQRDQKLVNRAYNCKQY